MIFRIKFSKWWHLYALEWICLFLGDKTQKTYLNKTSIYAFALFFGTEINLLCSAFNAIISTWLFYIFQWLASKRGVLWSILIHDHSTNLSKFWTSFGEMQKIVISWKCVFLVVHQALKGFTRFWPSISKVDTNCIDAWNQNRINIWTNLGKFFLENLVLMKFFSYLK